MLFEQTAIESQASQEKEDLDKALRIIRPYAPKVIVEIGTWMGYSARNWIKEFDPDLFITLEQDSKFDVDYLEGPKYHYFFETNSNAEETVSKVKGLLRENKIDLLFIDGGHRYDNVMADYSKYVNLVKEGGIVVFHDILYSSNECQVKLLWEDLKRNYDYVELNCGPGSTGYGILFNIPRVNKQINSLH